ncbi:MAG: class I SAM-dependent methyltransferase [Candidatus Woesearchaeota archaeon]
MVDYDKLLRTLCPAYPEALKLFALNAQGSSVLELGIGNGNIALAILSEQPGIKYKGIDIDPSALAIATDKLKGYDVTLQTKNLRDIDYESVDTIVSSMAIHHLSRPEQEDLFRKVYGACKRFLHFELIAPENNMEARANEKYMNSVIEEAATVSGFSKQDIEDMYRESAKKDLPLRLSEHICINESLGFKVNVLLKDHRFAFYACSR